MQCAQLYIGLCLRSHYFTFLCNNHFAAGQPRLVPSLEVLLLHGDTFFGRMPDEAEVEDRPRSRGPGLPQKPQQNDLRVPLPRRGQPQQPRHQMSDESCIQKR